MGRRLMLLGGLALLGVSLLVGGCGKKSPAIGPDDVVLLVRAAGSQLEIWQEIANAFSESTKIKVVVEGADAETYEKRLRRNPVPDLAVVDSTSFPALVTADKLLSLEPYLRRQKDLEPADYYPAAWRSFQYQGQCYGLPNDLRTVGLLYNDDLLQAQRLRPERCLRTWEEYLATARELTGDLGAGGVPEVYGTTLCPWWQLYVWQNGGDVVDDPTHPTRSTLDTPAAQAGLQFLVDLSLKHHVAPAWERTAGPGRLNLFAAGKVAVIYATRDEIADTLKKIGFMWGVAPLPRGKQAANLATGSGFCVLKSARHPDQAWKLAAYLAGVGGQQQLANSGYCVTAYRPLAETLRHAAQSAGSADAFLDAITVAHPLPYSVNYAAIARAWEEELRPLWAGQASVAEVTRRVDERVNRLLSEAQPTTAWLGGLLPRG